LSLRLPRRLHQRFSFLPEEICDEGFDHFA
jgi:hypothetical protein